jgi:hypothetical protein
MIRRGRKTAKLFDRHRSGSVKHQGGGAPDVDFRYHETRLSPISAWHNEIRLADVPLWLSPIR